MHGLVFNNYIIILYFCLGSRVLSMCKKVDNDTKLFKWALLPGDVGPSPGLHGPFNKDGIYGFLLDVSP